MTAKAMVGACLVMISLIVPGGYFPVWADESPAKAQTTTPNAPRATLRQTPAPVAPDLPLLMAEGANECEIVSCGVGIKQTCKITCPPEKTPKCSCDCERSFGPMCMDYKANCRCE